jgi:hypothetical protein
MRILAAVLILLASGAAVAKSSSVAPRPEAAFGFDPARHMLVSEVKPGMRGYGLSVFKGTQIERFEVEVVSILHNLNPRQDVVLVRCKGANLEHTGAVAGMSGSPVFLEDEQGRHRMIGAFAYGWRMMKDPVGGVQPIEYMLRIPPATQAPAAQPDGSGGEGADISRIPAAQPRARWRLDDWLPTPWKPRPPRLTTFDWRGGRESLQTGLGPLATPLAIAGMPRALFDECAPMLRSLGMLPVQMGAAGAGDATPAAPVLEPGSAVALPLLSGDLNLTAIGTVTEVQGDRILAFGHPFLSDGEVTLPMSAAFVHAVMASQDNSFKLGSALDLRGMFHADRLAGMGGQVGQTAPLIPIEVRCVYDDGTQDETYRFRAAQHTRFTPILAALAAATAISAQRDLPQYHTLDCDLTLQFANGQALRLAHRTANTGVAELFNLLGSAVMTATENPFERATLQSIKGTVRVSREVRAAEVVSATLARDTYRPGETVRLLLTYRPFRGAEAVMPLGFDLPADLPDGSYDFAVMDWRQHLSDEQSHRPFRFMAESLDQMFDVLRDYLTVRRDAVYLRLLRQQDGVAIGRTAMPRLPSSMRRVLADADLGNATPLVDTVAVVVPSDYVMTGGARFTLTVEAEPRAPGRQAPRRVDAPSWPSGPEHRPPLPVPALPQPDELPDD